MSVRKMNYEGTNKILRGEGVGGGEGPRDMNDGQHVENERNAERI